MIEKMKAAYIIVQPSRKTEMLKALQDLGVMHLAEKVAADPKLIERLELISRLSVELHDYMPNDAAGDQRESLTDAEFDAMISGVLEAKQRKSELENEKTALTARIEALRSWGDFDPELIRELCEKGVELTFWQTDKKGYKKLCSDENVRFIRLASVNKMETLAVLGEPDLSFSATQFRLPEKGLSRLTSEVRQCADEIEKCEQVLRNAAASLNSCREQLIKTQNLVEYSAVSGSVKEEGSLIWISGFVPESAVDCFTEKAKQCGWAWYMRDVVDSDEGVPTKVKYNKVTKLIKPVFDILGTVPGYREYDISFWFLAFFTLFCAMIIGDAGYGMIFLIIAALLTAKQKKVTNVTMLLYILSGATIVWGAITGTWFGLEGAMRVPLLRALVLPGFANYPAYFSMENTVVQNNVMKFCFSIGTIQLALACVMNIRHKLSTRDLSWLSDLGWLASITALYFMVLFLVIGQKIDLMPVALIVGAGFIMVILFGGMAPDRTFLQGLKAGLGNAFTVFLNTISAFGNIMSYIRLFAVGMASLAIAQSFNNMAAGFSGPLVIVGAVIMIIGHLMNIVMGLLSVVVHGVRLNLLEFSGQLGMEWSGVAYDPFTKHESLKK